MTQPSRIDGLPDLPKPHAAFEAKMIEDGYTLDFFRNHGSDRYCYMETEWAFRGYEAGSAAAAQAAKQVPAGFVLVPREPTRAMWLAAEKLLKGPNNAYRIWEDMIAAASSATSLAEAAEAGQVEAANPFVPYYDRTKPLPAQGSLHPTPCIPSELGVARHELNTHANALRCYIDGLSGDAFQGAIASLSSLRDIAYNALAATPASPQAVVGEASEERFQGLDADMDALAAALTPSPAPSASPHQGADALREALSQAARDVLAERQRQISKEGWTHEHDDEHDAGELAEAASAYAAASAANGQFGEDLPPSGWPWEEGWWRPAEPRRMLVKAGALILAEIERLDRAALAHHQAPQQGEQHE